MWRIYCRKVSQEAQLSQMTKILDAHLYSGQPNQLLFTINLFAVYKVQLLYVMNIFYICSVPVLDWRRSLALTDACRCCAHPLPFPGPPSPWSRSSSGWHHVPVVMWNRKHCSSFTKSKLFTAAPDPLTWNRCTCMSPHFNVDTESTMKHRVKYVNCTPHDMFPSM